MQGLRGDGPAIPTGRATGSARRSGAARDRSTGAARGSPGMRFAPGEGMRPIEPARWDDYVLATLLLLIGVPRVILAALYDRPLGVEGTLAIICVVLGLLVVIRRRR
jgi:hypothetical protein